jgi:hypothetical protein
MYMPSIAEGALTMLRPADLAAAASVAAPSATCTCPVFSAEMIALPSEMILMTIFDHFCFDLSK